MSAVVDAWITDAGYEAVAIRQSAGHLCGYVAVEPGHRCYGVQYDRLYSIQVHGYLTYSAWDLHGHEEGDKPRWWLGFDCAHFGDTPEECDLYYVRRQCEQLAAQLNDAVPGPPYENEEDEA